MRSARSVFLGLAAALALVTAARLPAAWDSGNALDRASGTWITLADDLARGTFYRPLHDPALGYGGTRSFPLAFALHAGLVRMGVPLLPAGYALSLAAAALAVLGAFALLRRIGAPRPDALAFATLALCGFGVQHGVSAVRGDLLPVGLSALGLAAVASRPEGRGFQAAVLFALACAAEPTSLTAPAAAVAWLALRREPRRAASLALSTAALSTGVVAAADALSSGRFLEVLRACALGGAGVRDALLAPWKLGVYFVLRDPAGLVLVAAAVLALAAGWRPLVRPGRAGAEEAPLLLPALWLAASLAGAVLVLGTPGTGASHLAEVEVAAAVALGAAALASARSAAASHTARLAAPAAAAAGFVLALGTFRTDLSSSRLHEARAIARELPAGPVLSEDPLVPLAAGARPMLLDAGMLRLAGERDPGLVRGLEADIAAGRYAAVVLVQDPEAPGSEEWSANGALGADVASAIRRSCRRAGGFGRYDLYVPRERRPPGGPARPSVNAQARSPRVVAGTPPR